MKYVLLSDGTRIDGALDKTNATELWFARDSYEEAGAVRDLFTKENVSIVKVFSDEDSMEYVSNDLFLVNGCSLSYDKDTDKVICYVYLRYKMENEVIQDEIEELQEIVLN